MSTISVYLIRKNTPGSHADDKISIRRQDNNILVQYRDTTQGKHTREDLLLTNTSLGTYIRNLGYLFLVDTEPFESIQFNFPGFPAFMATRKSLADTNTQEALVEVADIVSESWFADYPAGTDRGREDPWAVHY